MPLTTHFLKACCLALGLALGATAQAHSVPNLVVELEIKPDRSYELRVNFDPRLFLSDKPTSLPAVAASWWLTQTEAQRAATQQQALDYLHRSYELHWGSAAMPAPVYTLQAMNGADSSPLVPDTAEVHLLATLKGQLPAEAKDFVLKLLPAANAALVLLTSRTGDAKAARPQVIFTGESSRPLALP
jgi:hypothetical protein